MTAMLGSPRTTHSTVHANFHSQRPATSSGWSTFQRYCCDCPPPSLLLRVVAQAQAQVARHPCVVVLLNPVPISLFSVRLSCHFRSSSEVATSETSPSTAVFSASLVATIAHLQHQDCEPKVIAHCSLATRPHKTGNLVGISRQASYL